MQPSSLVSTRGCASSGRAGLIKHIPRLVAVQSDKCDPLVRAFSQHRKLRYMRPATEADAIAVGYPTFGFEALSAIRFSRGFAIGVEEREIEEAVMGLEKLGV